MVFAEGLLHHWGSTPAYLACALRQVSLQSMKCDLWNATIPVARRWLRNLGEKVNHIPGIDARDSHGRTRMEIEGGKSILRMYRFLRRQPGLENVRLEFLAPECGVRETARIERSSRKSRVARAGLSGGHGTGFGCTLPLCRKDATGGSGLTAVLQQL